MTNCIFSSIKNPHFFTSGERLIAIILKFLFVRNLDIYNPQNEMYQKLKRNVHFFERGLNGAKVIKNTDRLVAYPCFFAYTYYIE